jgi:hypothetical protein
LDGASFLLMKLPFSGLVVRRDKEGALRYSVQASIMLNAMFELNIL